LEVDNTGSVAAATLVLSDTFDADTTYVAGSLRREDDGTTDCDDATFTDAVDGDEASFDGTDTVEFTHATLGAGDSVTFCADVTINCSVQGRPGMVRTCPIRWRQRRRMRACASV